MTQQRNLNDRIADARTAFNVFREELTSPQKRQVLADMTGSMQAFTVQAMEMAQQTGDLQLHTNLVSQYAALVQASINLDKVISGNDRAALVAAVMATQSGISRPILDIDGE